MGIGEKRLSSLSRQINEKLGESGYSINLYVSFVELEGKKIYEIKEHPDNGLVHLDSDFIGEPMTLRECFYALKGIQNMLELVLSK